MTEIVISALLVIGGIFGLIGSLGLLKLRVPMQRLHAPTKATTIGVGTALFASLLDLWIFHATVSWQELLVMGFLFLTAPITTQFLAKAHLHLTVPRAEVPDTGTQQPWATYAAADADD